MGILAEAQGEAQGSALSLGGIQACAVLHVRQARPASRQRRTRAADQDRNQRDSQVSRAGIMNVSRVDVLSYPVKVY